MNKLFKKVYAWFTAIILFLSVVSIYLYEFKLGINLFMLGFVLLILRSVEDD